ncbi:hypothetical protein KP509_02G101400 [Ceratopteris richardii]|uniref:Thioredoxin domain-containing protein n=1 Tax=Ceratopteris richardii TaxID=49495 RepID=A0A8T2VH61_CERRI|nr:hypothetical protein KP509_02G101400 [Ceratopteris richardii]
MGASHSVSKDTAGSHGNVHIIKDASDWDAKLFEASTNGKVIVVDFTASWCGPCRSIAPVFADLSEKYPNMVFLKVDVDEHSSISEAYDVQAMPTFVFIVDSKVADRVVGANKAVLERKVKEFGSWNMNESCLVEG